MNHPLLARLRDDLQAPRELSAALARKISDTLTGAEPLEGLTAERVAALEEYEQELLLSPLFTPHESNRAFHEAVLPDAGVPAAEVAALGAALLAAGVEAQVTHGGQVARFPLPAVVVTRYLALLHLERPLPPHSAALLGGVALEEGERLAARAALRGKVWQTPANQTLLHGVMTAMVTHGGFALDKLIFLGEFVHTYRPADAAALVAQLHTLIETYRHAPQNPVFSERLASKQLEAIRSQHCGEQVKAHRLAMAHALLADLGED